MDGSFGLDRAEGTRMCRGCKKKNIHRSEMHLAVWHPNGNRVKRDNYCKQCAVKLIGKIKDEIFKIEETLYGYE